jgi:hypothetical protein
MHLQQNMFYKSPIRDRFGSSAMTSKSPTINEISPLSPRPFSLSEMGKVEISSKSGWSTKRGMQSMLLSGHHLPQAANSTTSKLLVSEGHSYMTETNQKKNMLTALNRRDISVKIDRLYQAKSLERRQENMKDTAGISTSLAKSEKGPSNPSLQDGKKRPLEIKRSRVAVMRKMFDRGDSIKCTASAEPSRVPSRCNSAKTVIKYSVDATLNSISMPPSLVPISGSSSFRVPKFASKLVDAPLSAAWMRCNKRNETLTHTPPASKFRSFFRSKGIGDRMRLFENEHVKPPPASHGSKRVPNNKRNRSLERLFEPRTSSRGIDGNKRRVKETAARFKRQTGLLGNGMSGKEIHDIVDEFQHKSSLRLGRRTNPLVGSQNLGQDGAHSDRRLSPISLGVREMVVKEAKCGLKHPKPLRLVEITRMMEMCREKAGSIKYKEKRPMVSRKLG